MNLAANLWYVKWFFWSCDVIDRFALSAHRRQYFQRKEKYRHGTNLCHFFRTLLFGTVIFASAVGIYGFTLFTILVQPFLTFTAFDVFSTLGVIAVIVAIVCSLVASLVFSAIGFSRFTTWAQVQLASHHDRPGFAKVVLDYYHAVKQQICPIIAFTGAKVDDTDAVQ